MDRTLIYDVGVYDGEDSAYYLSRGHRVIGIEADPLLAERLRARFATEIEAGAFVLLNLGVGAQNGEADFWISDRQIWSSFDREMASRDGLGCRAVKVQVRRLGELFEEFGKPFYCKVDVEGFDGVCIRTLSAQAAPDYLSLELDVESGGADLAVLKSLGYQRFKIISQVTRAQPVPPMMSLACAAPYRVAALMRRLDRKWRGANELHGWKFGEQCAGPFAEDTPGRWHSYEETLDLWRFLNRIEARREAKGLHEWFDLHAARSPAAEATTVGAAARPQRGSAGPTPARAGEERSLEYS